MAAGAALLRFHHRLREHPIDLVGQQPSATVGHVHGARGATDRAVFGGLFKQPDFAVAELMAVVEIDTDGQACHGGDRGMAT